MRSPLNSLVAIQSCTAIPWIIRYHTALSFLSFFSHTFGFLPEGNMLHSMWDFWNIGILTWIFSARYVVVCLILLWLLGFTTYSLKLSVSLSFFHTYIIHIHILLYLDFWYSFQGLCRSCVILSAICVSHCPGCRFQVRKAFYE